MRRLLVAGLTLTLALTACGGSDTSDTETDTATSSAAESTQTTDAADETTDAADAGTDESGDLSYDVSGVEKVDEIAALLPDEITEKGKIVIGAAIDYAPAEFRAEDLQTAIGYDVDLGKAIGLVLGVETEVSAGEFASLLPDIGSMYDIGISSFTVTDERTANYNMVSYITVGSSYAVQAGNPQGFDPDDVCGQTIGVQTGTWQEEELATFSEACEADGKDAIEVLPYGSQSDVTTNLIGGKIIAFYADSTVSSYAVTLTNDQAEVIGGVRDAAPQGIVISQDDAALTEAIQKAVQSLMDDGTWEAILASWGVEDAALSTAVVYPES